jgi:hypothetical protein
MRYCGQTLGLKTHEIAQAAQMYRDGLSARQIAEHFDMSKSAVQNALAYAGVKARSPDEGRRTFWAMKLGAPASGAAVRSARPTHCEPSA